jgi:hypothetical protein
MKLSLNAHIHCRYFQLRDLKALMICGALATFLPEKIADTYIP